MTAVLIALGSNLGDRQAMLDRAVQLLAERADVRLIAASRSHSTRPVGGPSGQAEFLNSAAIFATSLEPETFLAELQAVERALGRHREGPRWSPRPIDLDILLYGSRVLGSPALTVPHPRMAFRRFVIEPAAEIAPDMRHPIIGWTLGELRDHLRAAAPYAAIAGAPGTGKSQLAAEVSGSLGVRLIRDPAPRLVPETHPTGAPGPAWEREIELLELRTAQLQAAWAPVRGASGTASGETYAERGVAVSDYWFDQALCYAELILPATRCDEYRARWQAAAATVAQPKLLVLLDAPVESLWQRVERGVARPPWPIREVFVQLREAIIDRATAPNRGPLLRLDSRQPEIARIELSAAIEAMN